MKKVLIVAPHFPPSNLAGVHRSRLLSLHLEEFGWKPIIVTVDHRRYGEKLDWSLAALVPADLRVERVGALPVGPLRIVGDVGLRGLLPLLVRIVRLARREEADFLYITIPSYYAALLGRPARILAGIPYGIDYIDPWVTPPLPGEARWSKAWISQRLARVLEPAAVNRAALITGVAERYYEGVLDRNPRLKAQAVTAAMPYGADARDNEVARASGLPATLFEDGFSGFRLLYAGAMLPRAFAPLEAMLEGVAQGGALFSDVRFHFIGTGKRPDDPEGYNIRPLAEKHGLWGTAVMEKPARIGYLEVLAHLEAADAVFILGSTEPHYTPSKVFQAVLSRKPIFAVLHEASTAVAVIRETGAGMVLTFKGEDDLDAVRRGFLPAFQEFRRFCQTFVPATLDMARFEAYSARNMGKTLAAALDQALERSRGR